jgi:hypothetical protein
MTKKKTDDELPIEKTDQDLAKRNAEFLATAAASAAEQIRETSKAMAERLKKQREDQLRQALEHQQRQSYEEILRENERNRFSDVEHGRRVLGYWLGGLSIAMVLGLLVFSYISLHRYFLAPTNGYEERFLWVIVAGHSIITIAGVYFAYQLLKASERLIFPAWWAKSSRRLMAAMLGIRDPFTTGAKTFRKVAENVASKALEK